MTIVPHTKYSLLHQNPLHFILELALLSKGLDASTHKGLLRLFSEHFVKTGQLSSEWSKVLNSTYSLRQLSDYDTDFTGTLSEAEMTLEKTKAFIAEVSQLLK